MGLNPEQMRQYAQELYRQQHRHRGENFSDDRQTLDQISVSRKLSWLHKLLGGAVIALLLLFGAYYSLLLTIRMPGDGGTGIPDVETRR